MRPELNIAKHFDKVLFSIYINLLTAIFFVNLLCPSQGIAGTMPSVTLKSLSSDIASAVNELNRGDARPDEHLSGLADRLKGVDRIMQADESMVPVDLAWVSGNLETIRNEPDLRRRRQMLLQWRDTIRLLEEDISTRPRSDRATRQEMEEALKRAQHVTALPSGSLWECSGGESVEGGTPLYDSAIVGETLPLESSSSGGSGSGSGSNSGSGSGGGGSGSSSQGSSGGSSSGSMGSAQTPRGELRPAGQPSQGRTTTTSQTTVSGKPPATAYQPPQPPPKPRVKPPAPPAQKASPRDTSWVQTLMKILYWVIVALCIIACGIVLWVIWQTWRQRVTGDDSSQLLGITPLPEVRKQAQSLFRQAEEAASANRIQEALRLIMTACLLLLEERSVLAFQESLTNGEYLGKLAERRQLQDLFKEPLHRFDGVVYGFSQPTRSDYDSFRDVFRKLGGAS